MKVSVHAGLTFHLGNASSNQYGRLDVEFSDIDPDLPLESQIASGKAAAREAFTAAVKELDAQVEALLNAKIV